MKVAGAIIQNRKIKKNSDTTFEAEYKGKQIYVSSDHGLGKPKYKHLTRFNIEVTDIDSGMLDVNDYQDFHEIRDAIIYALKGSCLIS